MSKTLIAGMLALSLAFTGFSTAPARADHATARALMGVAALFIIAKAIENGNRRRATPAYVPTRPRRYRPRYSGRSRFLPARCRARSWTRDGWFRYFGARCLSRYGARRHYPEACRTSISGPRGWRGVYGARCLHRRGFTIAWDR